MRDEFLLQDAPVVGDYLIAVLMEDDHGSGKDCLASIPSPFGILPLVTADLSKLKAFYALAAKAQQDTGRRHHVVKFKREQEH